MFDAIVLSNGWDDATAALQLLSHLQDDALSVALLIPMPRRASRKELTDALSSHYGSPGRLASYRRPNRPNVTTKINSGPVHSWSRKLQTASALRLFSTGYTSSRHSGPMQSMGESF